MNSVKKRFFLFCFFAVVILAGTVFSIVRLMSSSPSADPAAKSKNAEAAIKGTSLDERLGVDDNAALAFLYGADMRGSLDVCG
jgi:hypothetical protein